MIPKHPLCQDTKLWVVHGSFPSNRKFKSWALTPQGQENGLTHLGKPTLAVLGEVHFLNSSSEAWISHISSLGLYFLASVKWVYITFVHMPTEPSQEMSVQKTKGTGPPHHTHTVSWLLWILERGVSRVTQKLDLYLPKKPEARNIPHYDSVELGRETV